MNVCEPHFERWLIDDLYAWRRGKGRIAALTRARQFQARYTWCVHVDMRKYFDSIDHEQLLDRLARRFKDRRLLDLWRRIVEGFRGARLADRQLDESAFRELLSRLPSLPGIHDLEP